MRSSRRRRASKSTGIDAKPWRRPPRSSRIARDCCSASLSLPTSSSIDVRTGSMCAIRSESSERRGAVDSTSSKRRTRLPMRANVFRLGFRGAQFGVELLDVFLAAARIVFHGRLDRRKLAVKFRLCGVQCGIELSERLPRCGENCLPRPPRSPQARAGVPPSRLPGWHGVVGTSSSPRRALLSAAASIAASLRLEFRFEILNPALVHQARQHALPAVDAIRSRAPQPWRRAP